MVRTPPRPRSEPHRFTRDWSIATDYLGRAVCTCGSLSTDAVHRPIPAPRIADHAALAIGEGNE